MLIEKTLKEYIELAGSDSPTPGGGSVAALAGSLGGALTTMVGNLSFGKKDFAKLDQDIQDELKDKFNKMEAIIKELNLIIDEDAKAFDKVMMAFKMPKDSQEEKTLRSQAIQEAYKKALETPYRCADLCLQALQLQEVFALYGNINAITDVGVGGLLLYTGLEGALLNVRINLSSIKDEVYRDKLSLEMVEKLQEGVKLKEEILKIVYKRLNE